MKRTSKKFRVFRASFFVVVLNVEVDFRNSPDAPAETATAVKPSRLAFNARWRRGFLLWSLLHSQPRRKSSERRTRPAIMFGDRKTPAAVSNDGSSRGRLQSVIPPKRSAFKDRKRLALVSFKNGVQAGAGPTAPTARLRRASNRTRAFVDAALKTPAAVSSNGSSTANPSPSRA